MTEDKAVTVYRELASIPSLLKAEIIICQDDIISVSSTWNQRDLERLTTVKFNRSYIIQQKQETRFFDKIFPGSGATQLNEELLSSVSPCGIFKAIIRQIKNKKGEDQQYFEVWTQQSMLKSVNLTVVDKHGKVYTDGDFGCLNWSSDSKKIVYIAEKKQPKTTSYFDRKSCEGEEETKSSKDCPIKGDQYLFRDDWGETLMEKCFPVVCIFDISTETVTVLEGIPEGISPAQATWRPNTDEIVFSALYHEPYKVGSIFCDNRRSAMFHYIMKDSQCELISSDENCCRSPRFSPDGSKLVYLQNKVWGPHKHCKQLILYDWTTKTTTVVVDVVGRPDTADSFPGLFVENLPVRCWATDNETVYISTTWRSTQRIVAVNVTNKSVTEISLVESYATWAVEDVKDNFLLASRSSPVKSGQLVICDLLNKKSNKEIEWFILEHNHRDFEKDFSWMIVNLPQSDGLCVEGILLKTNNLESLPKQPLVVFSHGGPHSGFTAGYAMLCTYYVMMDMVLVCVNYRGSTGFGQDSVDILPGKVGSLDVQDVHTMAEHVLSQGYGDKRKVIATGGSHGGFLSLHMIGQYPDFYKVCAVRNPVCNLASMVGITDIPDWSCEEAGLPWDFAEVPDANTYKTMLEKSPIVHLPKVKAPTLLLIGKGDLRVPPKQGEIYYKKLRARGVTTKLLLYPENNHGLVKLEAETDCFINMHKWFVEHL